MKNLHSIFKKLKRTVASYLKIFFKKLSGKRNYVEEIALNLKNVLDPHS